MKQQIILICGATGFLGRELMKTVYGTGHIRVLARNEGNLINLKLAYPDIEILTGSVADECIVEKACKDADTVYLLSAFKHVSLAETQPYQCFMSNVVGTSNLLKHFKGTLFVAISTDKVAKISGVYGASKYIMEQLIAERNLINTKCRYVVPRYGNVIGSTGSVVPRWIKAAMHHEEITITDPDATRFFFTVEDAVKLIFEAMDNAVSGKPYIKHMKSTTVGELAQAIQQEYGDFKKINYIGLQQGENMHEYLDDDYCSKDADRLTMEELKRMI